MSISIKDKLIIYIAALVIFISFLYIISDILLPFVVAGIVAYFLNPAVEKLKTKKISRTVSAIIIIASFFVSTALILSLLLPALYHQLELFADKVPEYLGFLNYKVLPIINDKLKAIDPMVVEKIKAAVSESALYFVKFILSFLQGLFNSTIALLNLFSLLFITPIVTFYLLRDWPEIVSKFDKLVPRKHLKNYHEQLKEIDKTLSGYIRGQTNVCLILGTFYATALMLAGLDFGLIIGFLTGLLSFIPYVGVLFGAVAAIIVAFLQFGDITNIAIVASIFAVGQFIEGNFITPKLIGDKIGLHALWIIFGMLTGASLMGFVGMLIAVPVTAVIGVIVKFTISEYRKSNFYNSGA